MTGGLEHQFAGDAVRRADNESPSLTLDALDGNRLFDAGNLELFHLDPEIQIEKVTAKFIDVIASGRVPICLGGDHLIKFSAFQALMNAEESHGLRSLGIKTITAHSFNCAGPRVAQTELKNFLGGRRKLYVSIDLDAFHSSEAPAVEAHSPGGIFFSPVIELLRLLSMDFELAGMDVSEFLPRFDEARLTALLAAALAKEFYSLASTRRASVTT